MRVEELFEAPLTESQTVTIYHGDNHNTVSLNPRLMNNGNNEEGIGIYFSDDISVAEYYGRDVISAEVSQRKFIESREPIYTMGSQNVVAMMKELHKIDPEKFFYDLTDWGIELTEPDEVDEGLIEDLYQNTRNSQVRHWQVEMAEAFGVVNFVRLWNRYIGFSGTFHRLHNNTWYAVIDTSIRVNKVRRNG